MRLATRFALMACVGVLWSSSALAQNDVTFQVDLNPYITTCQFDADNNGVLVRGSFNSFDESTSLADDNSDGVYSTTVSLAEGLMEYKFYVSDSIVLSWENDVTDDGGTTGNRDYTVVAGAQDLGVVAFNGGDPADNCTAMTETYELTFTVDMSVQVSRGAFDPGTQVPAVAGAITDWGTAPVALQPDPFRPNVFSGLVETNQNGDPIELTTPGDSPYKFVILNTSDNAIAAWESGGDRLISVTGNEPDADADGALEATVAERFFNDVTADQVLDSEITVTYRVDLNSAAFYLADNGSIPGTPDAATQINGVWMNGPAMWESTAADGPGDGITDWLAWGETGLGTFDDFAFSDADSDNVWELTLTYPEGALRTLVGKLGINGSDNEGGFGNDSFYPVGNGGTIDLVFGAMLGADGTYRDDCGPDADGDGTCDPIYDPYILLDNTATPPTATAVNGTGQVDVANEEGPGLAEGISLSATRPNPAVGRVSFDLGLARAMEVNVQVIDLMGRTVATLASGALSAGETTLELDASKMAAGVYVLRVQAGGEVVSRRMTVVR